MVDQAYIAQLEQDFARINKEGDVGYGDGQQHTVLKDTHAAIKGDYSVSPSATLMDASKETSRQALRLSLASDASHKLVDTSAVQARMATDVESMARSSATAAIASQAMQDPLRASATALVETSAPAETTYGKMALEFNQYQLMTMAKRFPEDEGIGSKAMDFLGSMIPGRILLSTARAGSATDGNAVGYFTTLKAWNAMPIQQRNAIWDDTEQKIWDASGHNQGIYSSLINPFIDPSDEINAKVNAGLDAAFSLADARGLFALASGFNLARRGSIASTQAAALRFRARAMKMGNEPLAGRAAVSDIRNGSIDAMIETSPMKIPDPMSVHLTPVNMQVPTTLGMVEDALASGKLLPGQELVVTQTPLSREAILDFAERNKLKILSGGEVKGMTVDFKNLTVEYDAAYPGLTRTPIADVMQSQIERTAKLKDLRKQLKLIIKDTPAGEVATNQQAQELTNEIDTLSKASNEAKSALKTNKAMEATLGFKGDTVEVSGMVPAKVRLNVTVDEAGQYQFKDNTIGTISHITGSQETRIGNVERGLTSLGQFIRQQQRGLFGKLSGQVGTIQKTMRTGPWWRVVRMDEGVPVDALINTGDRLGKVFSESELKSGVQVDGHGLITFNQRQIDAYHAMRDLYDDYWMLADNMQARQLRFDGNSRFHVRLYDSEGKPQGVVPAFGKAREQDLQYSIPTVGKNKIVQSIDAETGEVIDLSKMSTLESDLNSRKKAFVKLQKTIVQGNGDHFDHLLVDVQSIGELKTVKQARDITSVMDYHPGYSPRITHEPVNFIIERPRTLRKNGVEIQDTIIDRAFGSRMEAEIYRDTLIAKRVAKVTEAGGDVSKLDHSDILLTAVNDGWRKNPANKEKADFLDGQLFSGAFVGNRHPHGRLKIGLDGHKAEQISSFEAARRYADFLGSYYPSAEYKSALIRKFLKSAKNEDGSTMLQISSDWTSPIISKSSPYFKEVEAVQNWMMSTFAVPRSEESAMMGFANQLGQAMDKYIWDRAAGSKRPILGTLLQAPQRALLGARWSGSPVTAIKSITFDMMLGMFNPVQYFIQSSGMFIPFHLHPLTGAKITPQFLALRTLSGAGMETVGKLAKSMGLNGEEFQTLWHSWHRSGVPDSILENADFGHYLGTKGAYYSPSMMRSMRDKSRMFYNAGELNNRMYAYVMAFNRMADKHGWDLTKRLSDTQIKEVNQEALRLGINFGAGNRARWQQGIMSIPTQFWQVGHKYVENIMNGLLDNALTRKTGIADRLGAKGKENAWTGTETASALLGGMLIWGYSSIGLDELFPQLDSWITDPKGLGLDPEKDRIMIAGLRGGFLEMMSLKALGVWPDVSDRSAPAAQLADIVNNVVAPLIKTVKGQGTASDFLRIVGGASNSMATRLGRAINDTLLTIDTAWLSGDISVDDVNAVFSDFGSMTSTFSNVQKFRMWKEAGKRLDSNLRDTGVDSGDQPIDPKVTWLRLLGLDTAEVEIERNLTNRQRDREHEAKVTRDALLLEFRKILNSDGTIASSTVTREANRRMKVIMASLPQSEQHKVWQMAIQEMDQGNENQFYSKLIKEYINADPGSPLEQTLEQEMNIYKLAQQKGQNAE
jgi:hypothetical protein